MQQSLLHTKSGPRFFADRMGQGNKLGGNLFRGRGVDHAIAKLLRLALGRRIDV